MTNQTDTIQDRYEFDLDNHIHKLDGRPLMGVTSVLSVISKPALIQWSANMAVNYVRDNSKTIDNDEGMETKYVITEELLQEAKVAHRKKKEKAGDWGTEIHKWVEDYILSEINDTAPAPEIPEDEMKKKAILNFLDWASMNKVEFLESERNIWSEKLWIGGICDLVVRIGSKTYLADIKTSSGIYNEAFYQMGAYNLCFEEMNLYKDIAGYIVINLKKDGKMEIKEVTDMKTNKEAFKYALGLYKIINSKK